jgi:hypothetical protein
MATNDVRDLPGLSRQVLYEFEMVEALAKRQVDLLLGAPQPAWRERFNTPDPLERDWFEENAMLESQLLHVRALTTLCSSRRRQRNGGHEARRGGGRGDCRTASLRTTSMIRSQSGVGTRMAGAAARPCSRTRTSIESRAR